MRNWKNLSMLLLLLASCSLLRNKEVTGAPIDSQTRWEQEEELKKADASLEERDFAASEKRYRQFQQQFPNSIFYQRAQFGLARSLEEQGRWSEAAELYRLTVEATQFEQKHIAAQALFELSFCYENLGDESRVLASLTEALKYKEQLLPEQYLAEIPARMAASYQRIGMIQESEEALRKAEAGIFAIRAEKAQDSDPQWLAQIYHRMGRLSTKQLSFENLQAHLDTLKMVQIFSLRSVEAGAQPWSDLSAQRLMENYGDLWKMIQKIPLNKAMNADAARREKEDRQIYFSGQLLALIGDLRMHHLPEEARTPEPREERLFSFLDQMEAQGRKLMMSFGEKNVLTREAQKRESPKKEGVTLKPVDNEQKESKDPNF